MKHRSQYKVYYEDTDSGGVVYYANYLKFLERARTDLMQDIGVSQAQLGKEGIFFVVKRCNVEYFSSAKLEDEVIIHSTISTLGNVSVEFEQGISVNDTLLVKAFVKIACVKNVEGKFKPTAIQKEIVEKLKQYNI